MKSFESDDVRNRLDEGRYDADTLLRWYWLVKDQIDQNWRVTRAEPLDDLMHALMEAMSQSLPSSPVDVERVVPSKTRLDWHRLERARVDTPHPVVVLGKLGDEELELLDGHHRVAKAKAVRRETLPAVWVIPRTGD